MVVRARWQECEAAVRVTSAIKKQREMNVAAVQYPSPISTDWDLARE